MTVAMRNTRLESHVAAKPMACGNTVAVPARATPCSPSFHQLYSGIPSRGTPSAVCPICETFSSSVIRDTRSAARCSTLSAGFLYAGSAEDCWARILAGMAKRKTTNNGETSLLRIGVCMPREIHFFYDQLWSGVVDEGRRVAQLGIEFVHRPVKILGEGDTQAFRELVESGVDGILLTAGNPRDLKPLIDDAEQKGIRVVCVSTDAPESRRSTIVCVEPRLNGSIAGELMGKFVPPGSKVAVVAGMLTAEDHRKKTDGFAEAFPINSPAG